MYNPIFFSAEYNKALETEGYVIVPFLNGDELTGLTDFFYSNHNNLPEGMYASSHAPDFLFRQKMNEEIRLVCKRALTETFENATALGATFMVKSKGQNGSLHPHQDWSIVDEAQFNSYNIWLPLVDVNAENGTLLILPNSHNWLKNTRGLNIPSSFDKVENEVWQYLKPLNVKAGYAVVYDHRLLHASDINKTDIPRLVIVYGIIPNQAQMRYYFGRGNEIEEYGCTADFYFSETITNGPGTLPLLSKTVNTNPVVTFEMLKRKYAAPTGFIHKLLAMFKPTKHELVQN